MTESKCIETPSSPSPPPKISPAKRRWRLLRNVHMGIRRTSLTPKEESFLKVLDNTASSNQNSIEEEEEEKTIFARNRLKNSICMMESKMTDAEKFFCDSLVITPGVSVEILLSADEALNTNFFYNETIQEETSEMESLGDTKLDSVTNIRSPSNAANNNHDPSFRMELWKSLQCSTHNDKENVVVEAREEETSEIKMKPEGKKQNIFVYSFNNLFQKSNNKKEEEKEDVPKHQLHQKKEETTQNDVIEFTILGASLRDTSTWPHVLSPPLMDALRPHMPFVVQEDNFWLKYSLLRDGCDMKSLLSTIRNSSRTVLAIETIEGQVFGSFTSTPWHHNGNHYYGSGESFLWRMVQSRFTPCSTLIEQADLESNIEVYKWAGHNRNIQLCNSKKLIVGGGKPQDDNNIPEVKEEEEYTFGLALSEDISTGTSGVCVTFDSPSLCGTKDVFEVSNVEVWTMTPVTTVEHAEKLELGRQFIFEQSNFVEY